jgi:hypothetical protein
VSRLDIRVYDSKIDLYECETMSKEELEFVMTLLNSGEYWEFRKNGDDSYTLHDKRNYKYKGTLEEIKNELR